MRALLHVCAGVLRASHMTGLAGQLGGVLGRWVSESHQPCAHVEPHSGPCMLPGDLGTGLYMLTYAGLDLSSPLGAKGLGFPPQKSSDPAPASQMGSRKGQVSSYPPFGHMGSG